MKFKKKGPKYIAVCTDGEIEYTADEFHQMVSGSESLKFFSERWLATYGQQNWSLKDVPSDARAFLELDIFFEQLQLKIHEEIEKEEDKRKAINERIISIDILRGLSEQEVQNPYSNTSVQKYYIQCCQNLKQTLENFQKSIPPQEFKKINVPGPKTFNELFDKISHYQYIKKLLSDKKYVHPNTGILKDEDKGNKGFLVAILKDLKIKGYYKTNIKITFEVYKNVAQNSFQCDISGDTIKKAKPKNYDTSFIPIASTLP